MMGNVVRWTWVSLSLVGLLLVCGGAAHAQDLGNIAGQIRLQDGNFPSQQVLVTLEARGAVINTAYCDSEGRFGFYDLLPNSYYVVIGIEGFQLVHQQVVVSPRTAQTNIVHVVLHPSFGEQPRGSPEGPPGGNRNLVDVSDFAKKFPPGVLKEFDAGRKADERGDAREAIKRFQEALRLAPDFYPARNNLGTGYMKAGDLKAAEQEFRQVIEQDLNGAQAHFNLGNILYMTRRNVEAKPVLDEGLRREPSSAMGHYLLGSVLARLGSPGAAEEQLKTARELDPRMPQIPIALATLYLQAGKQHEAAQMFEMFLQQFPKDPMVPKVRAALGKIAAHSSSP
jgi:Flp pilus assembly protein TadD